MRLLSTGQEKRISCIPWPRTGHVYSCFSESEGNLVMAKSLKEDRWKSLTCSSHGSLKRFISLAVHKKMQDFSVYLAFSCHFA